MPKHVVDFYVINNTHLFHQTAVLDTRYIPLRTEVAPEQREEAGISSIKTNGLAPVLFNTTELCCAEKQHSTRISQLAIYRKWPQTDRTAAQRVARPTCIGLSYQGGATEQDIYQSYWWTVWKICQICWWTVWKICQIYWWTVWKQSYGAGFDNTPTSYVGRRLEDWLSWHTWFVVFLSPLLHQQA